MPPVNAEELTEIEVMDAERADGVVSGANGYPFLMLKSVVTQPTGYDEIPDDSIEEPVSADEDEDEDEKEEPVNKGCGCCDQCSAGVSKALNAQGGVDEKPDIAGAERVLQELARLIRSEADEMAVGNWDEQNDISLLTQAASLISYFRCCEMAGDEDDGGMAKSEISLVLKRKVSTDERKRLASEGNALPDGSYPIENEEDLHNAAHLARTGHGDAAAAKRLIAKRAKELGVANPLASDAQKDAPANTETPAATEPQADEIAKADLVKAAVTEAIKPLKDELELVKADVARVLELPIPGGPVQTVPAAIRSQRTRDEQLAKAARFERMAEEVTEPDIRQHYQALATAARNAAASA